MTPRQERIARIKQEFGDLYSLQSAIWSRMNTLREEIERLI